MQIVGADRHFGRTSHQPVLCQQKLMLTLSFFFPSFFFSFDIEYFTLTVSELEGFVLYDLEREGLLYLEVKYCKR